MSKPRITTLNPLYLSPGPWHRIYTLNVLGSSTCPSPECPLWTHYTCHQVPGTELTLGPYWTHRQVPGTELTLGPYWTHRQVPGTEFTLGPYWTHRQVPGTEFTLGPYWTHRQVPGTELTLGTYWLINMSMPRMSTLNPLDLSPEAGVLAKKLSQLTPQAKPRFFILLCGISCELAGCVNRPFVRALGAHHQVPGIEFTLGTYWAHH